MTCDELKVLLEKENIPGYCYNILGYSRQVRAEEGFVIWKEDGIFVTAYVERNQHDIIAKSRNESIIVELFLKEISDYYPRLKKYV
ncbi:hypothetical protein [uncultured Phascolarctobacterium sp.]|uniref:hypothetical protein n=1 Tax=uncultured Phascolarctobacterium sp. TaxID=512296 RepID=UPI0025F5D3FA|nr:hypothetical protein [uncultured Phascolarctobacterium sp.]